MGHLMGHIERRLMGHLMGHIERRLMGHLKRHFMRRILRLLVEISKDLQRHLVQLQVIKNLQTEKYHKI